MKMIGALIEFFDYLQDGLLTVLVTGQHLATTKTADKFYIGIHGRLQLSQNAIRIVSGASIYFLSPSTFSIGVGNNWIEFGLLHRHPVLHLLVVHQSGFF